MHLAELYRKSSGSWRRGSDRGSDGAAGWELSPSGVSRDVCEDPVYEYGKSGHGDGDAAGSGSHRGWASSFDKKTLRGTDFWEGRGVGTYIAPGSSSKIQVHTIDYEYQDILNLGKIFDREEKAQELVSKMQDEIERAEGKAQKMGHHPRGLIIEYLGKDITVYGERTLAGNILTSMGGELLGVGMRTISKEQLIEMDPEALFMVVCENAYDQMDEIVGRLYQDQALQGLTCVKEKRIYPLPLYAIYSAGVRTYDGIQIIGKGLYPEE